MLCYVLPVYDPRTTTHLAHVYELLDRVSRKADVVLVVASGTQPVAFGRFRAVFVIPAASPVRRAFLLLKALVRCRRMGCRRFYVHYHVLAALYAIAIVKMAGGRTHFWSCVETRRYFSRLSWRPATWWRVLTQDVPRSLVLRSVDRLVTCNEHMAQYYARAFQVPPRRIRVMPNWVNPERFQPARAGASAVRERLGISPGDKVLLFLHTVARHKGADRLCDVFEQARRNVPNLVMLVVGGGPYLDELRRDVAARRLEDRIRLLGNVPNTELLPFFAAADMMINPSAVEEFGRILLEAMAAGVPFVSTDGGGGVRTFLSPQEQDWRVAAQDVAGFADKVVELLRDDERLARLKADGVVQAEQYSLDRAVDRFLDILEAA